MECQPSDSKKLFKVFDASKCKRGRKRRDEAQDAKSVAADDSTIGCHHDIGRITTKASLQDLPLVGLDRQPDGDSVVIRAKASSPTISRSSHEGLRNSRSPRRHARVARDGISLALKAGMVSTPRSLTPPEKCDGIPDVPQDQDSFIYAFLEEAIKRDKKKHRHSRRHEARHEGRRSSRDREHERSASREHRHRHRRNRDDQSTERDKPKPSPSPAMDQTMLLETFAKLCAQMTNNKTSPPYTNNNNEVTRTQSHKSLQCEVASRVFYDDRQRPKRVSPERSCHEIPPYRIRSSENCPQATRPLRPDVQDKCGCCYDQPKYSSKIDVTQSRMRHDDERYRNRDHDYPDPIPTRNFIDYQNRPEREYTRDYERIDRRPYDEDKRRFGQTTSRSFDIQREPYDERCRRTTRSDRNKHYDDKYFDKNDGQERHYVKDRRRKNLERFERNSVASRDDEYRDRDRYSEKERDSGLSVADGETSTVSGRSNYLRAVKQEIAEQREAMDKMMKLWKELMRCFKGISHTQVTDNNKINQSAENVRESAAAQLRLWRECMRRYETVARDVGDTDARLMEEINKQRSEMAEMANMWQECLQRYRDMSNDFNTLKQQLTTSESPTRLPAPTPLLCAEGEGTAPAPKYCMPPNYPQMMSPGPGGVYAGGAALRGRASAPPWWWAGGPGGGPGAAPRDPASPRRRSSPDSRASSRRRHRHKDSREESRYKEKSKPSAARSEHRHRKR